jgi:hypothetical protein
MVHRSDEAVEMNPDHLSAEPHQYFSLTAAPFTEYGSSLAFDTPVPYASQMQSIEYPSANVGIDAGRYGTHANPMASNTYTDFGFGIDDATQYPAALLQELDWNFMGDAVAPVNISDCEYNLQIQMPLTNLPSFQDTVPIQYAYQSIAPAVPQTNLPGAGTGLGANVNALHGVHETRIRCTANGCTRTFRRPGDFRRHLKKHQAPTLKCIAVDCDMKFYRMDKLRDHVRQGHQIAL